MDNLASNRQKKLLRFFGVRFGSNLSSGAAGWEIGYLLADDDRNERWRKYVYLTKDFDSDTDQLKPFDKEQLDAVVVPADWHISDDLQKCRDQLIANFLKNNEPYDNPQPPIQFSGRSFAFTGEFKFGDNRQACQNAVRQLGGTAVDKPTISRNLGYLILGTYGSPAYKHGSYGTKIQKAILSRREFGSPSIISEDHWVEEMAKHG